MSPNGHLYANGHGNGTATTTTTMNGSSHPINMTMAVNHKNKDNEIPPDTTGGLKRMLPHFGWYMGLLMAVYGGFYYAFASSDSIWGLVPAAEFCYNASIKQQDVCRRPDLFAFQMASVVAMYTLAALGIYSWYITQRPQKALPPTPQGRLLGYLREAEILSAYSLAYQTFDFVVSLTIPEHCTPIMMTHHFLAAAVAFVSIRYQVLHYYSFFFLGLSEVSTLFLVWMDLSNFFPPIRGSTFAILLETVAGPCFVVAFVWYRVCQWWPTSVQLFRDAHAVLSTGYMEKLRPGQSWVLWVFLLSNVPLGLLQLYWTTIIWEKVQKTLVGP